MCMRVCVSVLVHVKEVEVEGLGCASPANPMCVILVV